MGGLVSASEAVGGDVSVDLGGGELGVAEHFLDASEVGASVEQMGGEAVAEFVGRDLGIEPRGEQMAFQAVLKGARWERAGIVTAAPEDGLIGFWAQTQDLPVGLHRPEGMGTDGNEALFAAFAEDADHGFVRVQILHAQAAEFGDTQAAGVDEFENGGVARGYGGVEGAAGFRFLGSVEFACGSREEGLHLFDGEESDEASGQLWKRKVLDWSRSDVTAPEQEPIERAQGGETQADGGGAEGLAAEVSQEEPELFAGDLRPIRRALVLGLEPGGELVQGLGVVAQRVRGYAAFGREVVQKPLDFGVARLGRGIRRNRLRRSRHQDSRATS